MSTSNNFKLERDLCRCCHSEGTFYHLTEPVYNLGQREVYSEMLKTCLDLDVLPMVGELSMMTYKICGPCVLRLRDAHNFKQQIILCEERFKEMYHNIAIRDITASVEIKEELPGSYQEEVKKEYAACDDDDGFDIKFDDSDDDQPVIKIKVEESKTAKTKPKTSKVTQRKKKAPAKKSQSAKNTSEQPQLEEPVVEKGKKGKKGLWTDFTIVNNEEGIFYRCNQCGRMFNKRTNYTQHYKHVHKRMRPRSYRCRLCSGTFTSIGRARHMETFHGIPAPKCNICDRKFAYEFMLLRHQRVAHLGEKNFTCEMCGNAYGDSKSLNRHKIKHCDLRPWACPLCGKTYIHKKDLQKHLKGHPKNIICPICDEGFCAQIEMKHHIEKAHPELC